MMKKTFKIIKQMQISATINNAIIVIVRRILMQPQSIEFALINNAFCYNRNIRPLRPVLITKI